MSEPTEKIMSLERYNDICDETFGDGYYEGFLDCQEMSKQEHIDIADITEQEVLLLSEDAEEKRNNPKRRTFSKNVPSTSGYYFHWSGIKDEKPELFDVKSFEHGGKFITFISRVANGVVKTERCSELGGYWLPVPTPKTPTLEDLEDA